MLVIYTTLEIFDLLTEHKKPADLPFNQSLKYISKLIAIGIVQLLCESAVW